MDNVPCFLLKTINQTTEPNMRAMKDKISQFDFDIGMDDEKNEDGDDQGEEIGQVEMDLMNNKEVLEQRGKQLREIHKVSAIIKDTTDKMAQQVNEQGEVLINVENHIDKATDNVEEAHKAIVKADGYSKGNNKRLIIIIIIIIIAVGAALGIILPLALKSGKDDKSGKGDEGGEQKK
jgi:Mg2+ and Co2+ transporter CorA